MRPHNRKTKLLGFVFACLILTNQLALADSPSGHTGATGSKDGGHLIVYRAANFGTNAYLKLYVDGVRIATVPPDQTYDGYLSPGRHVLSGIGGPADFGQTPITATVDVKQGETYSFTAIWQGTNVALIKN